MVQRGSRHVFEGRHGTVENGAFDSDSSGDSGEQSADPREVQSGGNGPVVKTDQTSVVEVEWCPQHTDGMDIRGIFARQSRTGDSGVSGRDNEECQLQTGGGGTDVSRESGFSEGSGQGERLCTD